MRTGRFFRIPESPGDVEWLWLRGTRLESTALPDWARNAPPDSFRLVAPVDSPAATLSDARCYTAELEELHAAGLIIGTELDAASRHRIYAAAPRRWCIGIYAGESLLHLEPAQGVGNPVLTGRDVSDVEAAFVADPFMVRTNAGWHMFFEVMNWRANKGEIGLATSADGSTWTYQRIVLAEPFHLSYPYVFEWRGEHYLIPESHQAGAVRLYKATSFPTHWTFAATLLDGPYLVDASVVHYQDRWWLFVETGCDRRHDTLNLYFADDLAGPWSKHPGSPIVARRSTASRPGGRLVVDDGRLVRFAQSCLPAYGTAVRAFDVTRLDTTCYEEHELPDNPLLAPSGSGWNALGMHHIDPHRATSGGWIAAVDGWSHP